jgi:choline dehydrogenase-like flavoprotein
MAPTASGRSGIDAEIAVVGSGPGGAIAACLLAGQGHDVVLVEEGSHLPLSSAPHFSQREILQKYRGAGINVAMGRNRVAWVEGCCVGGGSEINRGLYHRAPASVLEAWSGSHQVEALSQADLLPHFEACEQVAPVSRLPGRAPAISLKLHEGATKLGWECVEVPRLFRYAADWQSGTIGTKQSMSETFIPRYLAAGGRLLPNTRVRRLTRHNRRWHLHAEQAERTGRGAIEIRADRVVLACGAVQTPALLRRSGIGRHAGETLRFHPMVKVVAGFPEAVNQQSDLEPVHQVKHFDPRFSMGCSISKRPALALTLADRPDVLPEVERNWRHMAIYYAQTTGGRGSVWPLPGFREPLVRTRFDAADLRDLAEGLRRLCECLFAAGADVIYPGLAGAPALRSEADLALLPDELTDGRGNITTLHLFSSCPMGEAPHCTVDSFGRVLGADGLFVADASALCGPTVVNPQGTVMAVAHRNALHLGESIKRRGRQRAA